MSTDNATTTLGGDYALDWNDFVGQKLAKLQLQTAITSAKRRGARLDHILLASGMPGIGKTNLAQLVAADMGTHCKTVTGKIKVNEARLMFSELSDGDILFYDELHTAVQGGKANAEWLLNFLQDGCLPGPFGMERQPQITVIAATTDMGKLPETIIDRFPIKPKLTAYPDDEGALIAHKLACRIIQSPLPVPSAASCVAVAAAANNNPRIMRGLWCIVRDIAVATECSNYDGNDYDITLALEWEGLTADGLSATAQRYLIALHDNFQGLAGRTAIQDALREPGGLHHTERVLVDKGFIILTRTGRELTTAGSHRAKNLGATRRYAA